MSSSSGNSLLKFLVPVVFIFLIGGFVAYNSGLFPKPVEQKPKTPKKTALPIVIPPKNTLPGQSTQAKESSPEKPEATKKTAGQPVGKIREVYISSSKSTVMLPPPEPETTLIQPVTDTQPPREVYFPSSKSMPVKFEIKPQGGRYQLMEKQKKQQKK